MGVNNPLLYFHVVVRFNCVGGPIRYCKPCYHVRVQCTRTTSVALYVRTLRSYMCIHTCIHE